MKEELMKFASYARGFSDPYTYDMPADSVRMVLDNNEAAHGMFGKAIADGRGEEACLRVAEFFGIPPTSTEIRDRLSPVADDWLHTLSDGVQPDSVEPDIPHEWTGVKTCVLVEGLCGFRDSGADKWGVLPVGFEVDGKMGETEIVRDVIALGNGRAEVTAMLRGISVADRMYHLMRAGFRDDSWLVSMHKASFLFALDAFDDYLLPTNHVGIGRSLDMRPFVPNSIEDDGRSFSAMLVPVSWISENGLKSYRTVDAGRIRESIHVPSDVVKAAV